MLFRLLLPCGIAAALLPGCVSPVQPFPEAALEEPPAAVVMIDQPDEQALKLAPDSTDPYRVIAQKMSHLVTEPPLRIVVGEFNFADTELMAPYSPVLREELLSHLRRHPSFEVLPLLQVAAAQQRDEVLGTEVFEPGSPVKGYPVRGADAVLRGRFYYQFPSIVFAGELAWFRDGRVSQVKSEIPVSRISERIWPDYDPDEEQAKALFIPSNLQKSRQNNAALKSRFGQVPHEFHLQLASAGLQRAFPEGDELICTAWSDMDAHITILLHEVEGSTRILYPTPDNPDTWVPAKTRLRIPPHRGGQEIASQPPFGSQVVQVIAASRGNAFHEYIRKALTSADGENQAVVDRGALAAQLKHSLHSSSSEPVLWSSRMLTIHTFPDLLP